MKCTAVYSLVVLHADYAKTLWGENLTKASLESFNASKPSVHLTT